jgi:AraC family transcriptional regulator of adaptative response/methylated-DNA-[protein]-cysteine methyltransferase
LTGFHDAFERLFGTPPSTARERAAALAATRLTTPLGPMVAVAAAQGLCLLEFADRPMLASQLGRLRRLFRASIVAGESPYLEQVGQELRSEQARALGRPRAQRAVGRANGDNRLAIVVPCHRVLRADGSLCGYGGGRWRKRRLLEHEGATPDGAQRAGAKGPSVASSR